MSLSRNRIRTGSAFFSEWLQGPFLSFLWKYQIWKTRKVTEKMLAIHNTCLYIKITIFTQETKFMIVVCDLKCRKSYLIMLQQISEYFNMVYWLKKKKVVDFYFYIFSDILGKNPIAQLFSWTIGQIISVFSVWIVPEQEYMDGWIVTWIEKWANIYNKKKKTCCCMTRVTTVFKCGNPKVYLLD